MRPEESAFSFRRKRPIRRHPSKLLRAVLALFLLVCSTALVVVFFLLIDFPDFLDLFHILLIGRNAVPVSISHQDALTLNTSFTHISDAYRLWDGQVGCTQFRKKPITSPFPNPSLQDPNVVVSCDSMRLQHISLLVKEWRWLPDNLDNLYSCNCGLTCLWTKSSVLADIPDAELFETGNPPQKRSKGEPLRVYMDLEPGRKSPANKDIFISYHANDTLQATYAGASFHIHRSYFISPMKKKDTQGVTP